jgi:hypothetical protein
LAAQANLTQGVISRAEDPDYGNLTVNTICRIAAGFDVAFIGKVVPLYELDRWITNLSEESGIVPSFQEENKALAESERMRALFVQQPTDQPFWDRRVVLAMIIDRDSEAQYQHNPPERERALSSQIQLELVPQRLSGIDAYRNSPANNASISQRSRLPEGVAK